MTDWHILTRRQLLSRLLVFLGPFAGQVALSVLLGVATVACGIGLLGTSAYLIASAALHPSVAALEVAIVAVRFFGIARAAFRYLERLVSHSVNFRLLAGLRVWFYQHLEPLAPARLQEYQSADLLSRAIADIETLENFYVRAVAPPLVALIVTAGASLFAGRFDPRLGLLLAGAMVTAGLALPLLAHLLSRVPGRAVVERRARLNADLLDLVQGMPDLLAYGQDVSQLARIHAGGESLGAAQRALGRSGALAGALSLLVSGLALWGVLLIAIPLVGNRMDGIALAVLALVTLASFEAVTPLAQAAQHLESSMQSARRLFTLVDAQPAVTPPASPLPAPERVDLRIRDLAFAYSDDREPALDSFSLDLPPGKHVALVGPSGAGKSTLFNLLLRFWQPDQGVITLNGQDISCYDPDDVRRSITLISQTTYLFAGTLRQNLLMAAPGAAEEALSAAIRQAQLEDLVQRLPNGLDTWLGERGAQISGGERQRVSVARALLRGAPLLLLDEPTANLDAVTEARLVETIRQASADRSVIYITHRLVGLEAMDEILVMREGRVIERGTHAGLLAAGGTYARMWAIEKFILN